MPTPLINGVNYSNGNVSVILFGSPINGIVSIKYGRKQKKENNYGAGYEPVSRGYGMIEYDGSIEIYYEIWKSIIANSPGRDPMRIPPFDIPVTFGGAGVLVDKDVLRAVEFMEDPFESKSGDIRITVTIPLIIGGITK
jgi:hypothetical protein